MNEKPILYHYVHCPFCVRVRMALGKLKMPYKSRVVSYDDEKTPLELTGVKMLPIMSFPDGTTLNESLDIIRKLDTTNTFQHHVSDEIEALLSEIGTSVHSLAMPYWIWTPEFDENSRKYFQSKKEVKRGPFAKLVKNREYFINTLNLTLEKLEKDIQPFYKAKQFGLNDILLASHLWGMFIVPEFQFSSKMYNYLMSVKAETNFDYHKDFWE